MENYERLTLDLIGNGLTPKAKYERAKFLLHIYDNYLKAKETIEHDLEYFGLSHDRHKQAQKIYDILIGKSVKYQETDIDDPCCTFFRMNNCKGFEDPNCYCSKTNHKK